MQYKKRGNLLIIRLFKGEDVIAEIKKALKKANFDNGVILSGIGMLKDVELRVFKGKGKYSIRSFKGDWELISFSGNIVKTENDYILHIHSAISDHYYKCFGGHFGGAIVAVTLELFIMRVPVKLLRKVESDTGLFGLYLQ
ncbi:MAG: DNA-binding protein [Deltaproteobacteria bacterium]|nr:DNA-binding protein [Deltaproteobacteria bacterium]